MSMMIDYIWLALLWTTYCVVHSALISISVTGWFKQVLADRYRFYRLLFNAFSVITLIPLVIYSHSPRFDSELLFAWSGPLRIVRHCLVSIAALLVVAGARHYSLLQFLGVLQIRANSIHGAMTSSGAFDARGVLSIIRHPWYTAVLIFLWTSNLKMATLTTNLVLSAYIVVGTYLEERKLVIEFGDEYRRYQDQVSMFIPIKWLSIGRTHHQA